MRKLIVIRGPTGVGKTTIANALIAKLGQGYLLKLDEISADIFQAYLTCSMKCENVVAELFFGNSHTTDPTGWLDHFPSERYERLSVLLTASLEDCLSGVIRRKVPSHWTLSLDRIRVDYGEFYEKYKPVFRCMTSRTSNPKEVVEEILVQLSKTYSQGRQTGPNV
ncbi:MAG: hypothetical protein WB511_12020 [Nitrososphaeraceae archaeon]